VLGCVVKEIEVGVEVMLEGGLENSHFDMAMCMQLSC